MAFFEGTILTSPADGISPTLLLSCGSKQCPSRSEYLFNLPESLDRLASDQKIKLKNVKAVFTPEVSTEAMGGLGSRLFNTTRSCAIIAPVGFQQWLAGVRLISRRLGALKLDHYVIRANGEKKGVYCYRDTFIDVAAITRNCKAVKLPKWLRSELDASDVEEAVAESEDEERQGKVGKVTVDEEDEVVFVKEVGLEERDNDDLPEVICIDLASDDEDDDDDDDDDNDEEETARGMSGEEVEGSDDGYSSGCSSDASFIPLFVPESACQSGKKETNKVPQEVFPERKLAQDEGPSAAGNLQDAKEEGEVGGGATACGELNKSVWKWCGNKNRKNRRRIKKNKKGDTQGEKGEKEEKGKKGKKKVRRGKKKKQQKNAAANCGVRRGPDFPITKGPQVEEPGCCSSCSSPPPPPVQLKKPKRKAKWNANPEEIAISSMESEGEVEQRSTGKKRSANGAGGQPGKKKAKLAGGFPPCQQLPPECSNGGGNGALGPFWGGFSPPNGPVVPAPDVGGTLQNRQAPCLFGSGMPHGMMQPNLWNGFFVDHHTPGFYLRPPPPPLNNLWRSSFHPDHGTIPVALQRKYQESCENVYQQKRKEIQNEKGSMDDVRNRPIHGVNNQPTSKTRRYTRDFNPVISYIIRVKSTDQLLLVVFAKHPTDIGKLKNHAAWKSAVKQKSRIDVVFHLSEMQVIEEEQYKAWMRGLPGKQLVVTSKPGDPSLNVGLRHVLDRGVRLNLAAPTIFPIPKVLRDTQDAAMSLPSNCTSAWILTSVKSTMERNGLAVMPSSQPPVDLGAFRKEVLNVNVRLVREIEALSKIGLINWSKCSEFYSTALYHPTSFERVQPFLSSSPEINSSGAFEYASSIARYGFPQCIPRLLSSGSQTGVFFFGTGCSEPSSWRGGSAILLRIEECGVAMMIDVGEGTYGQMVRYFGEEEARKIVDSVECIWISHQHGDHCLGVAGLIKQRSENIKPVLVLAPKVVVEHLRCAREAFGLNAELVNIKQQSRTRRVLESQKLMGLDTFLSVVVEHSCEAYGLVLVHTDGWKLVFSGDTRPCPLLRQAGMNCTLLIHEATHAPKEQSEAKKRMHSTWSEALEEGYQMNAYRTILTHFSRRYPNLPTGLTPEELGGSGSIAFDGMNVPFALLPFLPRLNPAIHEALHEIEEGGEIDMSDDDADMA